MRILFASLGILIVLAVFVDMLIQSRRQRETVAHCDGADWGTGADEGLATPCGKPLDAKSVHRVARVARHQEHGGSSATLGAFCVEHCPGDCANPHCHLTAAHRGQ